LFVSSQRPFIYAGVRLNLFLIHVDPFYFCVSQDDDEPISSPTSKQDGTMEDVIAMTERESGDNFIEISVEEPQKVGDGMHSYLAYK
jgi:hypothetical protein